MKVFIDPGHGGRDPGATWLGVRECDIALDISLRVGHYVRLLSKVGDVATKPRISTVFSREDDSSVRISNRASTARASKADLAVIVHINSSINPLAQGAEVWVCGDGRFANDNKIIAQDLLDVMCAHQLKRRSIKADTANRHGHLGVLQGIKGNMPAAYLEIGFGSNYLHDRRLLLEPKWKDYLAIGLAKAICRYLNVDPRLDLLDP